MKKYYLLLVTMMLSIMLAAQTQQGYVKTKGRLANDGSVIAGTRIPNATIQVKDRTPVVSQANGTFFFPIPANKFYLTNVQKQGYVLTDPDILSKEYTYSTNDLVLVMETPTDQWQDKHAAEKAMREQLQKQVDEQRLELERLKEEQRISDEEYRERLQRIFELYDKNDKLVSEMAEAYAKIDYDQLDEHNRLIRQYILTGELKRADSLIHSKGDMDQRISDLLRHQEANAKEAETLAKRQEQLEVAKAGTQKELEDIAQDCYNMFEICKMQHLNDSAAYWIELRAKLDTTNVNWNLEAGKFVSDYLADFDWAFSLYDKALAASIQQNGTNSESTAHVYLYKGKVYHEIGDYDSSLKAYNKALQIYHSLFGVEERIEVANVYCDLGTLYFSMDSLELSEKCMLKDLEISKKLYGNHNHTLAPSYSNLCRIYIAYGAYDTAAIFGEKAIELSLGYYGTDSPELIGDYHNTGMAYKKLGEVDENDEDYEKAFTYYEKALSIARLNYGERHPLVANLYGDIGSLYDAMYMSDKALEYCMKDLKISKAIYGEKHPSVASTYNGLGVLYLHLMEYDSALFYFHKSLSIKKQFVSEDGYDIGAYYMNLGSVHEKMHNYDSALIYYNRFNSLYKKEFGEHRYMAVAYGKMAIAYMKQDSISSAINMLLKAIEIEKATVGNNHLSMATHCNNIGVLYYRQKEYQQALPYLREALTIRKNILGDVHEDVASSYLNVANSCFYLNELDEAMDNYEKALYLYVILQDEKYIASCHKRIGDVLFQKSEYEKALSNYEQAHTIRLKVYGQDDERTMEIEQKIAETLSKLKEQENEPKNEN
ncbi:MAG: tetratricopeptide repeat protein [Bacteroidales bacterium]|nr:tetratricopeptide repeat protein [Bacteroidales bacterium]